MNRAALLSRESFVELGARERAARCSTPAPSANWPARSTG
jgi:hypothetical protein